MIETEEEIIFDQSPEGIENSSHSIIMVDPSGIDIVQPAFIGFGLVGGVSLMNIAMIVIIKIFKQAG